MASSTSLPDRFKLDTVFDGDTVVHGAFDASGLEPAELKMIWRRDGKLGAGAYGVVWRERGEGGATGKVRAVKVIGKQQINLWEVEALIELRSYPDLFVIFYGWFDDLNSIYIAMEYIAHGDLGDYIKEHGGTAKARSEIGVITSQILSGLVVLHGKDICHRDLKPQNILIASPSPLCVKITDFGISKREIGTLLKTTCGTTFYQAPEQLGILPKRFQRKGSYTNAIDIWALGIVVHEILTGNVPFLDTDQDSDPMTSLDSASSSTMDIELLFNYCHGFQKFPTGSLQSNGVSTEMIALVKSMLVANPNERVSANDALESSSLIGTDSSLQEAITQLGSMSPSILKTAAHDLDGPYQPDKSAPANVNPAPMEIGLSIPPSALGMHVLYPLRETGPEATIDIIAIHGLGGDSHSTWTDPGSGKLWLRDFLPTYLSDNTSDPANSVRVLTFGYDTTRFIQDSPGARSTWHTVAEDLLNMIIDDPGRSWRRARQRPIIFICHCIGGLIIKEALNHAHARSTNFKDIIASTKAIIFMGTPHSGSDLAQWQRLIGDSSTGSDHGISLLPMLLTSSAELQQLAIYFKDRAANLNLTSFFELSELDGITIVEEGSARMNMPNERAIGLLGNHRTICRFPTSDDVVLQTVMRRILTVAQSVLDAPSWNLAELNRSFSRSGSWNEEIVEG